MVTLLPVVKIGAVCTPLIASNFPQAIKRVVHKQCDPTETRLIRINRTMGSIDPTVATSEAQYGIQQTKEKVY